MVYCKADFCLVVFVYSFYVVIVKADFVGVCRYVDCASSVDGVSFRDLDKESFDKLVDEIKNLGKKKEVVPAEDFDAE